MELSHDNIVTIPVSLSLDTRQDYTHTPVRIPVHRWERSSG